MGSDQIFSAKSESLARLVRDGTLQQNGTFGNLKCGIGLVGTYDTLAHLYALILILLLSTFACGFPLLTRTAFKQSRTGTLLFLSLHFGTGVLIATAFVHLLPTAFLSLTHPCLASFFSKSYTPLAGLIAMTSVLIVVGLEMYLTSQGVNSLHSHGTPQKKQDSADFHSRNWESCQRKFDNDLRSSMSQRTFSLQDIDASEGLIKAHSILSDSSEVVPVPQQKSSSSQNENIFSNEETDSTVVLSLPEVERMEEIYIHDSDSTIFSREQQQKRQVLQCFMLEAGILFHSVFIGMALSVATGPSFIVFLIAIGFHQSFEGLALGARIAAIEFSPRSIKPWLMVLAYGTTTPIGQGIGILMHNMYDPQSVAGLLMVGIMNGISSGLLLYAGLVQLLAEDFLSYQSYSLLKGKERVKAFCSVIAGAFLMALVGAWA